MILKDVQSYLAENSKASLAELSTYFQMDGNALRPLLKRLIHKGRVRLMTAQKCSGCSHCPPEVLEFYEWIGTPVSHSH